jgi:hypothetical protein
MHHVTARPCGREMLDVEGLLTGAQFRKANASLGSVGPFRREREQSLASLTALIDLWRPSMFAVLRTPVSRRLRTLGCNDLYVAENMNLPAERHRQHRCIAGTQLVGAKGGSGSEAPARGCDAGVRLVLGAL